LKGRLFEEICKTPQPKAYFIGNEYKLMPEKMAFCEALSLKLLITMNHDLRAQAMYSNRLGCEVECIPSAGLDTGLYRPRLECRDRPIDIGYRAVASPLYLGHDERRMIADYFLTHTPSCGLKMDISLDSAKRLANNAWADFLNKCKAQLGTEAGGDYFELTDETRKKFNEYLVLHPDCSINQIRELFFKHYKDPVPVRVISGRNAEAAGTKTVQILFEGRYSDYLEPDIHYIPLKKDFSNFKEAMEKFADLEFCNRLTDNAYQLALQELTYEKLIEKFHRRLLTVI
jgi:hypothetical protein